MFRLKSYVELLLLVSIFPFAMTQIRNLSPLRGVLNTNPPEALLGGAIGGGVGNTFPAPFSFAFSRSSSAAAGDVGFDGNISVEDAIKFAFELINRERPQAQVIQGGAAGGDAAGASAESVSFTEDSFPRLEQTSLSHFLFRQTRKASERHSNCIGQPMEMASITLKNRNDMTDVEAMLMLPNMVCEEAFCRKHQQRPNCPEIISPYKNKKCDPNAPYKSLDGSCNNLGNPEWGASMRPFNRYLQPAYEDGIHEMRGEGRAIPLALPSARTVSAGLQEISRKPPSKVLTMMVMQWGQYLDHDLTHTPEATRDDNDDSPNPITCCEYGKRNLTSDDEDKCRPIDVSNDPLFRDQNRTCMRFVRSLVASKGCSTGSLGCREQQNQLTSYLDASQVYGSDNVEAEGLRTKFGGLLNDSQPPSVGHGAFLPRIRCPDVGYGAFLPRIRFQDAMSMTNEQHCFKAGDVRVNEQPALTSMHTLGLREHNNIASQLSSINPSWDDERLYQETRAIVSALYQQITYREFLPLVLGPDFMREFQLNPRDQGYDNSYDPSVDATITNVFAHAAFRFGHTLVAEIFKGMGDNVTLRGNFDEPLVLNNPSTRPTALLQGLTACPTRGSDAFFTPTLVNHLLSNINDSVGFDLMSLNIQRGRDHGLPPYHEWRQPCKLSAVNSFEDLFKIMDPEAANVFQASYKLVKDIDLFPAGLAENTVPGGLLGPTFSCIIAQQFNALKIGDRFWYENQNHPKPFTQGQLSALRQQSLASIMCQHLELNSLQPMAFRRDSVEGNQLQDCSNFPRIDLRFWSEDSYATPTTTPSPPTQPGSLCVAVGEYKGRPGMDQWCTDNCHHAGAQHCPTTHCNCTS